MFAVAFSRYALLVVAYGYSLRINGLGPRTDSTVDTFQPVRA